MKKILFFAGLMAAAVACSEAEMPLYDKQGQAINFWAPPKPGVVITYPDALQASVETYDAGSLELGLMAFAPPADIAFEVGVEIMGLPSAVEMPVKLMADAELSDSRIGFAPGEYKMAAGDGTALLTVAVDASALPAGQTGDLVLTFDYGNMAFTPGVIQRTNYTVTIAKKAGTPMPTTASAFTMAWGPIASYWFLYGGGYGAETTPSLAKLQFMAAVLKTANFTEAVLPSYPTAATAAKLNSALAEYKALNEADPANYPPLYADGTTWIAFP
jgi:hypothetical protein